MIFYDVREVLKRLKAVLLSKSDAADNYAVKPKIKTITIPTTGWQKISGTSNYSYYYDYAIANLTSNDIVTVNLSPNSQATSTTCGLCASNESLSGKIRLYAKTVPSAAMTGDFYVLKCVKE